MYRHAAIDSTGTDASAANTSELRLACDTAVRSLYPAAGIPAVAAAIPALNSLSMNPGDPIVRASATERIATARTALLPGTSPDHWLDQVADFADDRETLDRIGGMVEERDYQVAHLDCLLSALAR